MKGILKIKVSNRYDCEIVGLGEIYEIISVEYRRNKLMKQYKRGFLYLSSNKDHSGRGFTKQEVEDEAKKDGLLVVESGYADSPPWSSNPAQEHTKKLQIPFMSSLAKILFNIWIPIMERFYLKKKVAHCVYVFGKELNQKEMV